MRKSLDQKYKEACLEEDMERAGFKKDDLRKFTFLLPMPSKQYKKSDEDFNKVIPILKDAIKKHKGIFIDGSRDTYISKEPGSRGNLYDRFTIEYIGNFCFERNRSQLFSAYSLPNEIHYFSDIILYDYAGIFHDDVEKESTPLKEFHDSIMVEDKDLHTPSLSAYCLAK